jgi:nicotinamidase-related amidase
MDFPQWVIDRVLARQGCLHPYDTLDAATTAFVVIDLQGYYTQPGFQAEVPAARATFGTVNHLADSLRAAGGHVVWVQTSSEGAEQRWSHHHRHMLTPERSARRLRELAPGHPGFELAPGLRPHPDDARVRKCAFSALAPGSSDLDTVLRARGVRTVLIGGTATNVCCESTARDAMMMDYATVMVADALSAFTPQEHAQALQNWLLFFGDVLWAAKVIARLRPPGD